MGKHEASVRAHARRNWPTLRHRGSDSGRNGTGWQLSRKRECVEREGRRKNAALLRGRGGREQRWVSTST